MKSLGVRSTGVDTFGIKLIKVPCVEVLRAVAAAVRYSSVQKGEGDADGGGKTHDERSEVRRSSIVRGQAKLLRIKKYCLAGLGAEKSTFDNDLRVKKRVRMLLDVWFIMRQ